MTILDKSVINNIIDDKSNKDKKCYEDKNMLTQFSYNNNAIFNYMVTNYSIYESALIVNANDKLLKAKKSPANKTRYEKRQIIMVELGLNYKKLSYKHPCVVLEDLGSTLFVVPCRSGSAPTYEKDNGEKEIRNGYLEGDDKDGFKHLTTIIIKEAVCIDKLQVIKSKKSAKKKKITPEMFTEINKELHKLLFNWQNVNMEKQEIKIKNLESELSEKDMIIDEMKFKLEELKSKNAELENQINLNEEIASE